MFNLEGVLAVITGTSRGIGAGIAGAAANQGATVAACNRTAVGGDNELVVDLAEPDSWPKFAGWLDELVDRQQPKKLVFIHNAATLTPIGYAGAVDQAGYCTNVLLNSASPQVLGDAALATARRTGTSTVVIQLSSGAGKTPFPGWSSYCAAKAAVDMWVQTVGLEQGDNSDQVRVAAISPGVVATEMQAEIRDSDTGEFPNVERFRDLHDNGHLADPAEVGAGIWAMAFDDSWSNGSVLALNS